ncbi:mannosyltransferase putative-domain-containing protein [Naematelia encephala]|uniref:Mannosyltransferase putative-domain-containing protein n=1 Tax=Naematelia encephala TaxID=71784 RepID=A0A1Y2AWZ8_9TREE|nr:mannosyltransferase putative-domain-containing protein [Naematelia encephala]
MKPTQISLPSSNHSHFFTAPYRSSQLSPIPASPLPHSRSAASPSPQHSSTSSSAADADPQTPLLPTPGANEKGYPFFDEKMDRDGGILPTRSFKNQFPQHSPDSVDFSTPSDRKPSFRLPFGSSDSSRPGPLSESAFFDQYGKREIDYYSDSLPVQATLKERLDVWRNAPGGRGEVEGEVELGGFVQWNLEQCTTIHEQHNTYMIQKSANVWATMNRTSLHQNRMDLINHLEDAMERNLTEKYGKGRGIVMVAGNADTLERVKWSLMMLRSYDSKLPVQIYHFPSERPDDNAPIRKELRELGAELVEAVGQERDKNKNKSYHLKALAVVQCPWREILYLDSDSIPTRDPAYMFDAPNYRRLGIWATPDYWKTSANNPIWAIMGVKCRNEWEMETGQMFVDKKLHLDVFILIQYMLERHEWWFYFSDGDKDIFRWAMLALRKRWGVPGRWVGAAALPSGTASGEFCSHTMLQHDSWGEPLFVHYNLLKQIPSGVGRGFSWGRTKQLPLFNLWPATPATARLDEPAIKPADDDKPGLGDVDCDMLADADETGLARRPAKEMIMRRAARERGVKVKYHGGWISALCIDLEYIDPRPEERRRETELMIVEEKRWQGQANEAWEKLQREGGEGVADLDRDEWIQARREADGRNIVPDWNKSPLEVVQWRDDEHLKDFEGQLYSLGFKPSGPGF